MKPRNLKMAEVLVTWCTILISVPAVAGGPFAGDPFLLEQEAAYGPAHGEEFYGAVAAGPGEYFAVWVDVASGLDTGESLYGQRILPDGSFGAPGSLELFRDPDRIVHGIPAVAWNGSAYLVLWHELDTLYGMRVDARGQVLDPGGFVVDTSPVPQLVPAVASDGQDFLVVQGVVSSGSIIGRRVGGDGVVLDAVPITISSGADGLGFPKLTYADGVYLVVWAQTPGQAIRGARVTSAGDVLDPGGFNISGGGTDVDAHVDFDGENFYVTWNRLSGGSNLIMGAHVTPDGVIASGPTLLLDGSAAGFSVVGWPRVAWNGTHHLITLVTNEPLFSNSDLYAMRVDVLGNPVGGPFPVSTIEGESSDAYGIASVGSQWFIYWEGSKVIGVSFHYDSEGARVDADGTVLDQPHLEVATGAVWQFASAAAFDGTNFLCVFDDEREGPDAYHSDLYAVRVTPGGEPIESAAFAIESSAGSTQQTPDVIFGGGQYAVFYEDEAALTTGVGMVRVLPDGTVLDPEGIDVFTNNPTAGTREPEVAWNGQDYCVVWHDDYLVDGEKPLQFALVAPDGTITTPPTSVPLSDGAIPSGHDIASDGDGFVITWASLDCNCIRSVGITSDGTVAGLHTIVDSFGGTKLAWNGQTYLAAWAQWDDGQRHVRVRPLDATGAPTGPVVQVSGPHDAVICHALFADGDEFLLLTSAYRLFQLDAEGLPLGPPATFTLPGTGPMIDPTWVIGPPGTMLLTYSNWVSNPFNGWRAHGRIIDLAPTPGDLDGDGVVGFNDLLILLATWGDCPAPPAECAADLDRDGAVGFGDLLVLLSSWS